MPVYIIHQQHFKIDQTITRQNMIQLAIFVLLPHVCLVRQTVGDIAAGEQFLVNFQSNLLL